MIFKLTSRLPVCLKWARGEWVHVPGASRGRRRVQTLWEEDAGLLQCLQTGDAKVCCGMCLRFISTCVRTTWHLLACRWLNRVCLISRVQGTALMFFRRFYLNNSVMEYHPRIIMWVAFIMVRNELRDGLYLIGKYDLPLLQVIVIGLPRDAHLKQFLSLIVGCLNIRL